MRRGAARPFALHHGRFTLPPMWRLGLLLIAFTVLCAVAYAGSR